MENKGTPGAAGVCAGTVGMPGRQLPLGTIMEMVLLMTASLWGKDARTSGLPPAIAYSEFAHFYVHCYHQACVTPSHCQAFASAVSSSCLLPSLKAYVLWRPSEDPQGLLYHLYHQGVSSILEGPRGVCIAQW